MSEINILHGFASGVSLEALAIQAGCDYVDEIHSILRQEIKELQAKNRMMNDLRPDALEHEIVNLKKIVRKLNADNDVLQKRGDMTVTEMRDGFESVAIESWKKHSVGLEQKIQSLEEERNKMEEIIVKKIECSGESALKDDWMCETGSLVSIRPVGEEYDKKTFLGIFLGEIAQNPMVRHNKDTETIHVGFGYHNPAIFVPELKKTIYGYESWWGKIESEEQLKEITDESIDSVWYVKALKKIAAEG